MRVGKTALAMSAVGMVAMGLTACGDNTATAVPATAAASSSQGDKTSYGTNEVNLNVVGHAIFMVNADAADAKAGTPTGNTKQPVYKVGDRHDVIAPSTFVVKAGQQITINVWNYDDGQHSMTLDDPSQIADFNLVIKPAVKNADGSVTPTESTATFTAPQVEKGKILDIPWYCAFPCDGPDHRGMLPEGNNLRGYDGIMAGHIVVMG